MALVVRLALALVVAVLVSSGARCKSEYDLIERIETYRARVSSEVLAVRPGLVSMPPEADVRRDAAALAVALDLSLTDLEVTVERDVAPTGAMAARVADRLGAVPVRDVDEDGNRVTAPDAARGLTTSRVTVTGALHGEGFLVSRGEPLRVSREYGYSL